MEPLDLRDDAAVEGLLRRRRVAPNPANLYLKWAMRLVRNQRLSARPTAWRVDRALDRELVGLFLAKHPAEDALHLFYAIKLDCTLTNQSLRLAYASLRGYLKSRRFLPYGPVSWKSVVRSALASLLEAASAQLSTIERVRVAIAMLLAFGLYARGHDISSLLASQLRPPFAGQPGAAASWTGTLFPQEA